MFQVIQFANQIPIDMIQYNPFITTIFIVIGSLPFLFRNNESCNDDDDCPYFMKCCNVMNEMYCCTPNNYLYMKPIYVEQNIS